MDGGLLHRLANICKDFYTLTTIDYLFIYAGAKSEWRIEQPQNVQSSSMRINRCYGLIEGLQKYAPEQEDTIISKVINDILKNEEVFENERNALAEGIKSITQKTKVQGLQLEPLLSSLACSLANSGCAREVAKLTSAEARLDWVVHDDFSDTEGAPTGLSIHRDGTQAPSRFYLPSFR